MWVSVGLSDDISGILPYLNTKAKKAIYNPQVPNLT